MLTWVVNASEKSKYDTYFNRDKVADGFISGESLRHSDTPTCLLDNILYKNFFFLSGLFGLEIVTLRESLSHVS